MKIYNYNEKTKEYIGSEYAKLDVLETEKQGVNIYLAPANSTYIEPPLNGENEVCVYVDGKWKIEKDFRGQMQIDLSSGMVGEVSDIGELAGDCFIITKEQKEQLNEYTFAEVQDGKIVIKVSVDALKKIMIMAINEKRKEAREVEGAEYNGDIFDIDEISNTNLTSLMVIAGVNTENIFLYRSKSNKNHTFSSSEIVDLGTAVASKLDEIYKKSWELKEGVNAALSIEELQKLNIW